MKYIVLLKTEENMFKQYPLQECIFTENYINNKTMTIKYFTVCLETENELDNLLEGDFYHEIEKYKDLVIIYIHTTSYGPAFFSYPYPLLFNLRSVVEEIV